MSSQPSAKASLDTTKEEGRYKSCLSLQIIRRKMKWSKLSSELYAWFPWRESFVMVPMLSMFFNAILAASLSQITSLDNPELLGQGLVMIGLVSGASISIVTLTFSLTVLSIQIAAQSYSPRLLDDFLKVRTKEEKPLFGLIVHFDNNRTLIYHAIPHLIFDFVFFQRFFRIQ
jgi:uncharacterized membrane protein